MPAKVNYTALPWVTYTSPEVAQVGLTEKDARHQYGDDNIRIIKTDIKGNDRAVAESIETGFIKVIGLAKNGKILGVTIVSNNAGDMLPIWSLAIQKSMKMKDIAGLILPYPTIAEIHKATAGAWYKDQLFSDKTRGAIQWLQKLPVF